PTREVRMTFDPQSPVDRLDGQISADALSASADQAAMAFGTSVGGGQYLQTSYGLLFSPDGSAQQPADGDVWQGFSWTWLDVSWVWQNVNLQIVQTSSVTIDAGQQLNFYGPGLVYFAAPVEVCDVLIWCATDLELVSFSTRDLDLPAHRKVVLRIDTAADAQITGAAPAVTNQVVCFLNISDVHVTLTHEDPDSSGGNRFHLPNAGPVTLMPGGSAALWWDDFAGRWYCLSEVGALVVSGTGTSNEAATYASVTEQIFDPDCGLRVSRQSAWAARITVLDASPATSGVVTTETQTFAGDKNFEGSVTVAGVFGLRVTTGIVDLRRDVVGLAQWQIVGNYATITSSIDVGGASSLIISCVHNAADPGLLDQIQLGEGQCLIQLRGAAPKLIVNGAEGISGTSSCGDQVAFGLLTAKLPPTPVTGSRASGAALASLLAALAARGLIVDNTTA
ncbi:MAG TPA: hypothetical protein VFW33_21910, partial [Gemmataceae bacterium]|nr:hypothetical protein [Gemmataceae bacterium]